jgi:PiT family inorganic phosphate transporter
MLVDSTAHCEERYVGTFVGLEWQRIVDAAHFVSAGVVSFARGLNDAPKIAALLLVLSFVEVPGALAVIAVAMAAGGLLSARRVAMTMGRKITKMNHGQGFSANIATGLLVVLASLLGAPVSTTHVSVGSLFGIGLATQGANLPVVRNVFLSWVFTLPCAALLAGLTHLLVESL